MNKKIFLSSVFLFLTIFFINHSVVAAEEESDGDWRKKCETKNLFIFVNGARSNGEFSSVASDMLHCEGNSEIKTVNKGNARSSGKEVKKIIENFLKDNPGCDINITVASHSIGAVGVHNRREDIQNMVTDNVNTEISFLNYDPPYNEPWSHGFRSNFARLFSSDIREIISARESGIADNPDTINWTNGYGERRNSNVQEKHNQFIDDPSSLDLIQESCR